MRRWWRSALSALFFATYGSVSLLFGMALWPVAGFVRTPAARRRVRRLVRLWYRFFVACGGVIGLFRVRLTAADRARLASLRGSVVVMNHLTLIDVVILLAVLGDATCVVKAAAARSPFLRGVVRGAYVVNDDPERVLDETAAELAAGANVVVFPEGTRTPENAPDRRLRRGAAQIALHARAPMEALRLRCEPPVLAKGQPWWQVGERTIVYSLECLGAIPLPAGNESVHAAAVALTAAIYGRIWP